MATPAPVTPVVPVKKVSWLKKLGLDILKVLSYASPIEKVAEPIVEALIPASAVAFNLFDYAVAQVTNIEAGYAAITTAPTGVAKFQAVLPLIEQGLDQWVAANMPGSSAILKADTYLQSKTFVATNIANTVVQFLNSLPANPSTATTANATAVAAAVKAIVGSNPAIAAAVTTGKKS